MIPKNFIRYTLQGKSLYRILFNDLVTRYRSNIKGPILDLASGSASYAGFFCNGKKIIKIDINKKHNPDIIADINYKLPFKDESTEAIFLFNIINILKEPQDVLKEAYCLLKGKGNLYASVIFIAPEYCEPDDFCRFTRHKITLFLNQAGFHNIDIIPIGERFSAAVNLIYPAIIFKWMRIFVYLIALFFDSLVPKHIKELAPAPMGYFVVAKK